MPAKKIELSDIDISCIRLMAGLGLTIPGIATMLQAANGVKVSARTLIKLKQTDPRVAAAFQWAAGRSNFAIAQKLYSVATSPDTDPSIAFRACRYWEISRGGIRDPERRLARSNAAEYGRVVIQG